MLGSEVLRQRTHQMVQPLAHQHNVCSGAEKFLDLFHSMRFQLGFQLVLEIFLAQKIQAVAGYTPQGGVNHASSELAVSGVKKWAQRRHQKDQPASPKAFGEGLGVPGEKRHRLDHGQVKKAALDPPIYARGRAGIVGWLFQICCSSYESPRKSLSTTGRTKLLL